MLDFIIFKSISFQKKLLLEKINKIALGHTNGLFGYRIDPIHPNKKNLQFHNGLDIAVPVGTALYCPFDSCKIVKIWDDKGKFGTTYPNGLNGKAFSIDMPQKCPINRISFAHLSDWNNNKIGDILHSKSIMCITGNTGASTGPHVHICFWQTINGKLTAVDPLPWLCGGSVGIAEIPTRVIV
jgi:hypothetical protein